MKSFASDFDWQISDFHFRAAQMLGANGVIGQAAVHESILNRAIWWIPRSARNPERRNYRPRHAQRECVAASLPGSAYGLPRSLQHVRQECIFVAAVR